MAKPPAVKIPVRLDKGSIEKDARGVRDSLTSSLGGVAVAAAGAVAAYKALSAAFGAAVRIGKEAVKLSTIQIEAERKLIAAARMRGEFTRENFEALQKLNAETQRATGIGDEQQLKIQAQMSMMGLRNDQLIEATRATIGLAEATGQDLNAAMRIVVRTYAGNTTALKRYGIQAKSSADAMRILLQNFEIAKTRTQTLAGQTKVLGAAYGDMLEVFGSTLTKSGAAAGAVETLTNAVTRFTTFLGGDAAQRAINRFFAHVLNMSADTIDAILGVSGAIGDMLGREPADIKRMKAVERMVSGGMAREAAIKFQLRENPMTVREIMQRAADEAREAGKRGVTGSAVGLPSGLTGVPGAPGAGAAGAGAAGAATERGDTQNAHLAAFEHEKQIRADIADMRARELEATAEFHAKQADLETMRLIAQREGVDARRALQEQEHKATAQFYGQITSIGISGMQGFINGLVESAVGGEADLGAAMKGLFGTILTQLGATLVALGTAAIAAATASTPNPIMWPFTGGPMGVGGGAALVAIGMGLSAGGAAMGAWARKTSAGAGAAASRSAGGTAGRLPAPDFSSPTGADGRPMGQAGARTNVFNISFPGALPGSERRMARELRRLLDVDAEGSLLPAGG